MLSIPRDLFVASSMARSRVGQYHFHRGALMSNKPEPSRSSPSGEFRPRARRRRLVVQALGEETLVYDQESHQAHRLSPFAGHLWEACDGRRTIVELRQVRGGSAAEVAQGLRELNAAGLLEGAPPEEPTRRRMLGRLGRAAAVPAVVSILVPTSASAQSCIPNGGFCGTNSARCCSRCCKRSGASANTCVTAGSGACF